MSKLKVEFFQSTRKLAVESTGLARDLVLELVTRPLDLLRTQAKKMQAIRPTEATTRCIEKLTNLDDKIQGILLPGSKNVVQEDRAMEGKVSASPTSPSP